MAKKVLKDNRVRMSSDGLSVADRLNSILNDLLNNGFDVGIKIVGHDFRVFLKDLDVDVDIFLNLGENYYNNELSDEVEETYLMRLVGTDYYWVGGNEDEFENDFFDLIQFVSKENLKESCISADFQRSVTGISRFVALKVDRASSYDAKYNKFKLNFFGKKYTTKVKDGAK